MFSTVFGTDVNVSDSEMQETAEEMEEAEAAEAAEDSYYYEEPEVNHAVHSNMPDHTVTNSFSSFFLPVCMFPLATARNHRCLCHRDAGSQSLESHV